MRTTPDKVGMVCDAIRANIVSGRYAPGYRIVVDTVAGELKTSAGPVREAIRRLEAHGLVQHQPNVGATVVGMDGQLFEETMAVMAPLEGLATALSLAFLRDADLERLDLLNESMSDAAEESDFSRFADLNKRFHMLMYDRCPNVYLRDLIAQLWDRLDVGRRAVFFAIPMRPHDSVAEHKSLLELVRAGAPAAEVDMFVRKHKERTLNTVAARRYRDDVA